MGMVVGRQAWRVGLLTLCLAFCMPAAAQAQHWWHVGERGSAPGRVEEFVDQASIRGKAGHKLVSTMLVTEQPMAGGVNTMDSIYEVDCRASRSRSVARGAIDASGARAGQLDTAMLPWLHNRSGSFAANVQALACRGKLPDVAVDIGSLDPQLVTRAYFDSGSPD